MKKKILLFILPMMIMRLFSGNNFEILPEDCLLLIFRNLNTRDLFKIQEVGIIFHIVFEKYFKKDKEKEIKEYIKNITRFWAKAIKDLSLEKKIKLPKVKLINKILIKLTKDIFYFYVFNNTTKFYKNFIKEIHHNKLKLNHGKFRIFQNYVGLESNYYLHIFNEHDKKKSIIFIDTKDYIIINIPKICIDQFINQIASYSFNHQKKYIIIFKSVHKKTILEFLPIINQKIRKDNLLLIDIKNKLDNLNSDYSDYINPECVIRTRSHININPLFYDFRYYHKDITSFSVLLDHDVIDKNNLSMLHICCGYSSNLCAPICCIPLLNNACIGKEALKRINSQPWYKKNYFNDQNTLYNFLKNIHVANKVQYPERDLFCNDSWLEHFLPEFKNTVDPRALFLYLTELKEKKDPILENEKIKPLINWLENEYKNDREKHGFDMQKQLNNYLEKSCF